METLLPENVFFSSDGTARWGTSALYLSKINVLVFKFVALLKRVVQKSSAYSLSAVAGRQGT